MTKMLRRTVLAGMCSGLAIMTLGIGAASAQDQKRHAMMKRFLGNTSFELVRIDAQKAAYELGIELIFTGPTENTVRSLLFPKPEEG